MWYTFNGADLHRKIERAAERANREQLDPQDLQILEGGKLRSADDWEIQDLIMYMRDLCLENSNLKPSLD